MLIQQLEDLWDAIDKFSIVVADERFKHYEESNTSCSQLTKRKLNLLEAKRHLDSVLEDISLDGHCTTKLGGTLHRETEGDWNLPIRIPIDRWHVLWGSIKEQLADCVAK